MEDKQYPQRTPEQNRSGHLDFTQISETLDAAGITQRMVLEQAPSFNLTVTPEFIKDIFRGIAHNMYPQVTSTKDLTTKQWCDVRDVMVDALQVTFGVTLPDYPSVESLNAKRLGWRKSPLREDE